MEHGCNSTEVWTFALVTHATTASTRGTALLRPMLLPGAEGYVLAGAGHLVSHICASWWTSWSAAESGSIVDPSSS